MNTHVRLCILLKMWDTYRTPVGEIHAKYNFLLINAPSLTATQSSEVISVLCVKRKGIWALVQCEIQVFGVINGICNCILDETVVKCEVNTYKDYHLHSWPHRQSWGVELARHRCYSSQKISSESHSQFHCVWRWRPPSWFHLRPDAACSKKLSHSK